MIKAEINYHAGRLAKTFAYDDLSANHFPADHALRPLARVIRQRYRYSQLLLKEILALHKRIADGNEVMFLEGQEAGASATTPSLLHHYKLHSEGWVYQLRRTLDTLVQLVEILKHGDVSNPPRLLESDGIGSLLSKKGANYAAHPIVMGDGNCFAEDETKFVETLNDLFNGMKHSWVHEESHDLFCREWPTIVTFYARYNDLRTVDYHNHNALHLAMGFQDNVARILRNLRTSLDESP